MILTARIDYDCKCLARYFCKLLEVLREALAEDKTAPSELQDMDASVSQATYHRLSHFIKPDMLINIFSFADYYLKEICEHQRCAKNLNGSYRKKKGEADLHAYHRYLTETAGLDLSAVQLSYDRLEHLRKVRNVLIHKGGHSPEEEREQYPSIDGIVLGSPIIIQERFIWSTLDHTRKYLCAAAQA